MCTQGRFLLHEGLSSKLCLVSGRHCLIAVRYCYHIAIVSQWLPGGLCQGISNDSCLEGAWISKASGKQPKANYSYR